MAGGYQRLGDRIRITARLVDVSSGTVTRAANVDGPLDELFALQDRVAGALMQADARPIVDQAVAEARRMPPAPPAAGRAPGAGEAPRAAGAVVGAAGFAPGVAAGAIDGPPAPVPPEVFTRDADGRVTMRAFRLGGALELDGALREAVYERIQPVSGFVQQLPIEGAPATERTEVWVFYDDENVYVTARCWDSAPPSQWIANEMQRDGFQLINNDWFSVGFDTFYDRRNGMAFLVNPIGGFFDYEISDEGSPEQRLEPGLGPAHGPLRGRLDGRDAGALQVAALPAGAVAALGHPVRTPHAAQERDGPT